MLEVMEEKAMIQFLEKFTDYPSWCGSRGMNTILVRESRPSPLFSGIPSLFPG